MKKLLLFLIAMTMGLFSFAAQPKRVYAYGLSSTLVDKVYTFAFTSNETPTSGKIIFYDATSGELVGEIALTNPVLGKNEVEIAEYSLPGTDGQQLNWSVELSAAEVTAFEAVYTGAKKYGRGHAAVDNSPESNYFGQVYVTDRRKTDTDGGLYVYTPSLQLVNNDVYKLGRSRNGYSRPAVAADGTLFLADYTDADRSGIYVVDPSDLTICTQFYDGNRASNGLFTNTNGEEIGSSTSGVGVFGSGANTVLYTMMEDGSNSSAAVSYHIGQPDGSILKSWSNVPTWICKEFASINVSTNNAFAATEKGVWISQNDAVAVGSRAELVFIDKNGTLQFQQDKQMCKGAGLAVNTDNSKLYMSGSNNIVEYNIIWNGYKPTLELSETYSISYAQVSTLSLDYAGNLIACVGASYGSTDSNVMLLVQYTLPTDNNTCEVPAKKADVVTKVEPTVALYTITTNVNDPIMGSVSGNLGTYEDGAFAELTAVANEHYEFTGWTGDVTSTENPLTITVNSDMTITANFAKKQYTLTVQANDPTKGSVALDPAGSTYEYETEVTLTATANDGYEFVNWNNGSKANPLTIKMEEDTELTANFRAILPSSITLNAHPVKDYSASIVGTMKRAIQNGENTIVLTHEANGTAHIYNIAHATKTVTEISQEGVNAAADGFLSISDIAVTEDGKLVACNYVHCTFTASNTSYFYIWDDIASTPRVWFTSQKSGNYNDAYMGYTMALKGTSLDAEVTISAFNKSNSNTRYSHLYVVDGTYTDSGYKYSRDNAALHPTTLGTSTYELNASPLAAGKWIVDGELASPIEFVEKDAVAIDTYTALNTNVLGTKYNGASYLFHNDHHLMVAPYAADDKLAGVKILGITDGFANPAIVETNATLANAIDATTAAATAYVDTDGDLTIYLIADGKVYAFSEKVPAIVTYNVTATAGEGGTVEGGGIYEEGTTATVTASPAEHYDFVNWTEGGEVASTTAEYSFTVTKDIELTANFQEHTKYTITAVPNDENMGTVTGGDTYYVGETITLKATANSGYVFAGWADGEKNATRTVEVSGDATYTANFQAIAPRAWAYDLKVAEDGENYEFTFKATAAGSATLLFADIDGNPVAPTSYDAGSVVAGANTVSVVKTLFTDNKDVYWSVKIDGEAIPAISEVTDQSRGIYDFYNMMGVVVDNDPNSNDFGKIYIQQSYEYPGTGNTVERNKTQKAGIFIYDQKLDELNDPSNEGYQPTIPSGYTAIGKNRESFKRLAINPTNGNLVFGNNIAGEGSVWSVSRDNLTGAVTNIIEGVAGINNVNAICYDENGTLYVLANITTGANAYKMYRFTDGVQEELVLAGADKIFVDSDVAMTSDGRGGLWIAQRRDGIQAAKILSHINILERKVDFVVESGQDYSDWFGGKCYRAAIAYNVKENLLAVQGVSKISLFKVSYDASTGAPSISKYMQVSPVGSSVDGLAFDYAGDLYTVNSGSEKFQKFTLPTEDNICTVPAPVSQKLVLGTQCEVTVVNDPTMGSVEGAGQYEKGAEVTLKATANEHYQFVNWTKDEEVLSAEASYSFIVTEDVTITANFAELPKYTITVQANDATMGSVEGGGTVYVGESVDIKATPNAGYAFVKWNDDNTSATRTVLVEGNKTYTAIFQAMVPRAWAYDLRLDSDTDPDNYIFTFTATSAGKATLLFTDKAGTPIVPETYSVDEVAAGEKIVKIAKSEFGGTEDIYWSVQMEGAEIENMIEITDPTRNIYDFYNMMGVVVDNNPNSDYFGKIYVQMALGGTTNNKAQTPGLFLFDQKLNLLNSNPNAGIQPTPPIGYLFGNHRNNFHRLNINPTTGDLVYSYNIANQPAVFAIDRKNMTGEVSNLLAGVTGLYRTSAHCFDADGTMYVMDIYPYSTTAYAQGWKSQGIIYKVVDGVATEMVRSENWGNESITMASDGRGGLWVAQNRGNGLDKFYQLAHITAEGSIDWAVNNDTPHDFTGSSIRGALAYDAERQILAQGRNSAVELFNVTYDATTGVPTLTKFATTPVVTVANIDGLAFDYAGDLYVVNSGTERFYKYVLPTNDNTCTVPAPASQVIKKEARYTVTVKAEPADMGTVSEGGEYKAGETITITATPNKGYQFVNWTYGSETSTNNPLELVVNSGITVTAHFQVEPLAIKGIVKRAVQIGESTVVLTHENDGTPHLYKVVNGELEAEISQVGVEPAAAGYLSISDIAATEDGKLVACNYVRTVYGTTNGISYFYIWDNLTKEPKKWFQSCASSNSAESDQGYTMGVKGTSTNAIVMTTGVHSTKRGVRMSQYSIIEGKYIDVNNSGGETTNDYYFYFGDTQGTIFNETNSGTKLEMSSLSENWVMDGNMIEPILWSVPATRTENHNILSTLPDNTLGKKFNGATYFSMYGNHFMVAPYADTDGNLAGVRVLNITQGLDQATEATDESLDLTTPISATAAATAVKVNGEELTITLVADNQLFTLATTLDFTTYTRTVTNGNFGTICLPYGSSYYTGAKFYEISWMKMRGTTPEGIYLDEVIEPLIAGKPYIFKATSNLLTVYANTDAVNEPIPGEAGLTGTFEPISTDNRILEGNYMIAQNKFWLCGAGCSLSENRAYIDAEIISQHTTEKQEIPGRRRISMGAAGENGTTGVDNLTEDATIQPNAHGTYDVLGRQLKEPTVAGFYIINGQKVIITK